MLCKILSVDGPVRIQLSTKYPGKQYLACIAEATSMRHKLVAVLGALAANKTVPQALALGRGSLMAVGRICPLPVRLHMSMSASIDLRAGVSGGADAENGSKHSL